MKRIWEWKDDYQARIGQQQQAMGCSCEGTVRHTFFRMFKEGLIYRGDSLVNWDCRLEVVRRAGEWILVRTPAGQEGWLPAEDIASRRQAFDAL